MDVSDATMDAFYANAMLSPTDKAIIVEALASLGGGGRREIFVAGAARAPSIEMGFFYRRQAALIAAYNKRVAPIRKFVRLGSVPMLKTSKGIVSILPVDYLIWTRAPRAARRERGWARWRRAIGDLDHRPGKRDGHDEARQAWLEGRAQGRRPAWAVIEHRPTDEEVRGPNGVNLIPTTQFRARQSQNSHSSTTAASSHCKFGNVRFESKRTSQPVIQLVRFVPKADIRPKGRSGPRSITSSAMQKLLGVDKVALNDFAKGGMLRGRRQQ